MVKEECVVCKGKMVRPPRAGRRVPPDLMETLSRHGLLPSAVHLLECKKGCCTVWEIGEEYRENFSDDEAVMLIQTR